MTERAEAFPIEDVGVEQGNLLSPLLGNMRDSTERMTRSLAARRQKAGRIARGRHGTAARESINNSPARRRRR